ncbi:MAG: hypothetical protein ACRCX2_11845 [Paraclostridium sp.]
MTNYERAIFYAENAKCIKKFESYIYLHTRFAGVKIRDFTSEDYRVLRNIVINNKYRGVEIK